MTKLWERWEKIIQEEHPLTYYTRSYEKRWAKAGADVMHRVDVEFLKRYHPRLGHTFDGIGFITIDIQKEDWETFIEEDYK